MSIIIRDNFGFALRHSVIGLENSHHSLNQSDANYNQSWHVTRVFPRFWQFVCFDFLFSLANVDVNRFLILGHT